MSKYKSLKDIYVAQSKAVPRTANTQAFHEAIATGLRAAGVIRSGGTLIQMQFVRTMLALEDKEVFWQAVPSLNQHNVYVSVTAAKKAGFLEHRSTRHGQLVRTTDKFRELVSNASIELAGVGEAA